MFFRILGPLEIEGPNGEKVGPWAPKLRALVSYLCCHNSAVVSCERLRNALWSETLPESATTALHVYISQLRGNFRSLGLERSVLVTQPTGYQLQLPDSYLDLNLFETHMTRSRELRDRGELEEASEFLSAAIGLWRGPALDGFRELPAYESLGQLLDEKRAHAHEQRLQLELELGRHHALIGELYSLVAAHPTWESIYGYLMISLYRSGRTADALGAFNRIRRTLVEDLGMEPGPRLQKIQRSILARDTWLENPSPQYGSPLKFAS
ncbi:AfsR/SARP family transcriptional regulator [Streptomyces sp. DT24]|uniref:AfsR/SARP family transcriptional regulator n=1 Tax=unclassified Streptomyces TaxID=2593676 RepID=UPI0023B8FEC5|nr:AfsR/SARP family transcriptional regulator [Streptomyces sp. AM 4-1-1]WEH36334.1 AfsR/SARP family transcriptional regulator [Streptomyces sp. AM 4-1-1]